MAAGAYYGLIRFGKKENVLLRGGLLGALTGLGVAFLDSNDDKTTNRTIEDRMPENHNNSVPKSEFEKFLIENRDKILTVALFMGGGVLAGSAVKKLGKKKKKK